MRGSLRIQKLLARPGSARYCDCCERRSGRFLPFNGRDDARCPHCESLERHRFLWPHLRELIVAESRVLHFAPEPIIARNLQALPVTYIAADLDPSLFTFPVQQADITQLPWADQSFDVIVISHVLEHVLDDRQAMRELHRVLASAGMVVSQHPHDPQLAVTFEDATITSPEDRQRAFGQYDHVRMYGRDIADRWQEAGFTVRVVSGEDPGSTLLLAQRRR